MKTKPDDHELEVSVFGPGYGECIVVHLGSQHWVIVDSCVSRTNDSPVALRYFERIGVDISRHADLVVVTHWHDDHIRGMSQLIDTCENAAVCVSGAFTKREFLKFLTVRSFTELERLRSGVDEYWKYSGDLNRVRAEFATDVRTNVFLNSPPTNWLTTIHAIFGRFHLRISK